MPAYLQPLAFVSSGVIQPDAEAEPQTSSGSAGLGFGSAAAGQGFLPAAGPQPCSDTKDGQLAAVSAAAGLGYGGHTEAGPANGAELRAGLGHGSPAAEQALSGAVPAAILAHDRGTEDTAGAGAAHQHSTPPPAALSDDLAAWVQRYVDAAAAADFERVAGESLAAVLLRGVDRCVMSCDTGLS